MIVSLLPPALQTSPPLKFSPPLPPHKTFPGHPSGLSDASPILLLSNLNPHELLCEPTGQV